MYINNHFHSNLGRLDIYKAVYAVAYTQQFNQDFVKFFNSLTQAYKFISKVERPRFFYRHDSNFNYWFSADICNCGNKLVVYPDGNFISIFEY